MHDLAATPHRPRSVPEVCRGWRWAPTLGALLLAQLAACSCGSSNPGGQGSYLPCDATTPCPSPLVCDEGLGRCIDPGGSIYSCSPPLPGCTCSDAEEGESSACLLPDTGDGLVASCLQGVTICQDGAFSACEPFEKRSCSQVGASAGDYDIGPDSEGVKLGPEGEIVLDPDTRSVAFGFVWIANTGESTVSKIDIETGKEVARYASVRGSAGLPQVSPVWNPDSNDDGIADRPGGYHECCVRRLNGQGNEYWNCDDADYDYATSQCGDGPVQDPGNPAPGEGEWRLGHKDDCGNCPSRTAINFKGDAFVANRAHMEDGKKQATVTKFANQLGDCVDRNGNQMIDTSTDMNLDGRIDINNPAEFLGEDDECILWTAPVGTIGANARALAIDAGDVDGEDGNLWVGLYARQQVVQLSGDTGLPIMRNGQPVVVSVDLNTGDGSCDADCVMPYGAAADGLGNIWVTGRDGDNGTTTWLAQIQAASGQVLAVRQIPYINGISDSYGIAVDLDQRVWLGGWKAKSIAAFDQFTQIWHQISTAGVSAVSGTETRGIAIDGEDRVWVAFSNGYVGRYSIADILQNGQSAQMTLFDLPSGGWADPSGTIGVGIDRNGACWAVSRTDGSNTGVATRIASDDTLQSFPVGKHPYTYSDFAGFGLTRVVRPDGVWRTKFAGCTTVPTNWLSLSWTESEPPGTKVRLRVRVSDTIAGLASATWYGPFDDSPVDLDRVPLGDGSLGPVPSASYMELEVQMATANPRVVPKFYDFQVGFETCRDAIE